jgi:hypothetical protein
MTTREKLCGGQCMHLFLQPHHTCSLLPTHPVACLIITIRSRVHIVFVSCADGRELGRLSFPRLMTSQIVLYCGGIKSNMTLTSFTSSFQEVSGSDHGSSGAGVYHGHAWLTSSAWFTISSTDLILVLHILRLTLPILISVGLQERQFCCET